MEENKTNLGNDEATNNINVANNASNEIEAPGTTLGVNPPSDNVNTINNETNNNQVKSKNNKKKIIIIVSIIVGVILLAIIAMLIYVKVAFNAGKYLDEKIVHLSISIECKIPKISPKIEEMRKNIARVLNVEENCIGITATTGEGLTEFGKGNGISVFTILTVE